MSLFKKATISLVALFVILTVGIAFYFIFSYPNTSGTTPCLPNMKKYDVSDCLALRSAISDEKSASASYLSMILSFVALLFTGASMTAIVIAFFQGKKTIELGIESNKISSDNTIMQSRAYVLTESVKASLTYDGTISIWPTFVNSGSSPALELQWLANSNLTMVIRDNISHSFVLGGDCDFDKSHIWTHIAANASKQSHSLSLIENRDPCMDALIIESEAFFVKAYVNYQYKDVFGNLYQGKDMFQGRLFLSDGEMVFCDLNQAKNDI